MRLRILSAVVLLLAASVTSVPAQAQAASPTCTSAPQRPAGMRLSWHDEFGGRALDRRSWSTVMDFPGRAGGHYHNTSYGSYAVDENVVLSGGKLRLVTDNKPVVGTDPAGTYQYTEGFISSHDKFFQTYGYWEICAKFPAGKGVWPAFWLIPQDRSWPPEIDVAEWFGSIESMHSGLASGTWPDVRWDSHWATGLNPTTGWHTYGVLWSPGRITFTVDGKPTSSITGAQVPDKPMYVVLNSGTWANPDRGGPPDATTPFPNSFDIDYVRAYQPK
ncbi:glycoside hydrolase family 16 protein [Kribbella sp. NBC_00482]|uniref:glycoside hydrolase family 16 protein n=1 Tax=Kribbella sp. NBC_00482 TaxID=2975968 RepID=UPI002E18C25F